MITHGLSRTLFTKDIGSMQRLLMQQLCCYLIIPHFLLGYISLCSCFFIYLHFHLPFPSISYFSSLGAYFPNTLISKYFFLFPIEQKKEILYVGFYMTSFSVAADLILVNSLNQSHVTPTKLFLIP